MTDVTPTPELTPVDPDTVLTVDEVTADPTIDEGDQTEGGISL